MNGAERRLKYLPLHESLCASQELKRIRSLHNQPKLSLTSRSGWRISPMIYLQNKIPHHQLRNLLLQG